MPLLGLVNRSGRSLVDAARMKERHHASQDTDHRGNSVGDVGHILGGEQVRGQANRQQGAGEPVKRLTALRGKPTSQGSTVSRQGKTLTHNSHILTVVPKPDKCQAAFLEDSSIAFLTPARSALIPFTIFSMSSSRLYADFLPPSCRSASTRFTAACVSTSRR
mgnify:CR=1 FL=1